MKKKIKKVQIGQAIDTPLPPPSKQADKLHSDKAAINRYEENKKIVEILFDNKDDNELAEEETVLVGSGPRSAFRWFKGRRYLNYASQRGLDNSLLPNDQLELDRMRVLAFIIRWAFKGDVVAPVEQKMKDGIEVLNVGFGPGMWTGHHLIDMAMDYGNSQFTAVDVMDLLPPDFEETAISDGLPANQKKPALYHYDNIQQQKTSPNPNIEKTVFTPMHPNLSLKLQNTTTPVINSSTLDSNSSLVLSQIGEATNEEEMSISAITNTTSTMTFETGEEDLAANSSEIEQFIINSEEGLEDVTREVKHRKLLPNLDFYQVNVIDAKLPFEDNRFDFVMQRLVTASFTVSDWKNVLTELVRVTKPGGYIQLLEIDYNTFNLGPNGRKWETTLIETARLKRQLEPRIARNLSDALKAVGLIDVQSKLVSIPLGSWGLDLGNLWKHNMDMFVDSSCPLLSKLAGVTAEEYRAQWYGMFDEVKGQKPFSNMHAAWGRKPLHSKNSTTAIDWSLCPPLLS